MIKNFSYVKFQVEIADFDTLQGKLMTQKVDEKLSQILLSIQNTHLEN